MFACDLFHEASFHLMRNFELNEKINKLLFKKNEILFNKHIFIFHYTASLESCPQTKVDFCDKSWVFSITLVGTGDSTAKVNTRIMVNLIFLNLFKNRYQMSFSASFHHFCIHMKSIKNLIKMGSKKRISQT